MLEFVSAAVSAIEQREIVGVLNTMSLKQHGENTERFTYILFIVKGCARKYYVPPEIAPIFKPPSPTEIKMS